MKGFPAGSPLFLKQLCVQVIGLGVWHKAVASLLSVSEALGKLPIASLSSQIHFLYLFISPKKRGIFIPPKLFMNISLHNKRALVCGSTQGIGKATAMELAALGATVTLMARNEQALQAVLANLPVPQQQAHSYLLADFANTDEVQQAITGYLSVHEGFHILVNNTGGPAPGPALDATPRQFLDAFAMHLVCNQHLVQTCVPYMKAQQYGRIINIISTSVKVPIAGLGVSNTIRGAVASWAKTLATELAPFQITVNNVLPGFTQTGRLDALIRNRAAQAGTTEESYAEIMKMGVPARRFAAPEEVAYAVAFLAGECAAYITGTSIPVDGGSIPSL